ncbi:hypothetical protein GCM10023075_81790 [Streptosporangium album]
MECRLVSIAPMPGGYRSAGVQGHRRAAAAGGWLRLAYVRGPFQRILALAKPAGIVPFNDSLVVIVDW